MDKYVMYTDGGCTGNSNGGVGGYGVVILQNDEVIKKIGQGYLNTTNNRMEMMAAIKGLEAIPEGSEVTVYLDSQYVRETMRGNFKRKKNLDLWPVLDRACMGKQISWEHVDGHTGDKYNEICDELSKSVRNGELIEDEGFAPRQEAEEVKKESGPDKNAGVMELDECRSRIDNIDGQIVKLFEERMKICDDVADFKIRNGKNVLDRSREEAKIAKVRSLTHSEFNAKGAEELFEQIMSMSRKKQYALMNERGISGKLPFIRIGKLDTENARVVYQGTDGAYSQEAMFRYFGRDVRSFHVDTFRDAMSAIDEGTADYAVLPIENSSAGIVSQNYDLLVQFENYIVAEQVIDINHCLLGLKGAAEDDIKTVYSHPQALMQCGRYLDGHRDMKQISLENTAVAAKKIIEDNDPSQAAIAGAHCASYYGLEILKENINFSDSNSTRFIIVTNQKVFVKDAKKVSICFEIPHRSGSLYHILSHFIYNDLNMNRIESRPITDRPWEYRFFIDFDGNLSDSAVKNALHGLREETLNMKILGNY